MLKQHFSITVTLRMDEVLAGGQDQFENISKFGKIYFLLNEAFDTLYALKIKNVSPSFMQMSSCLAGKIAFLRNRSIFTSVISKIMVYKLGRANKNFL
jgi:hypothetical protein